MGDSEEGDLTDNDQTEGMRQLKKVYPLLLTQDEDTQGTLRTAWVKGGCFQSTNKAISIKGFNTVNPTICTVYFSCVKSPGYEGHLSLKTTYLWVDHL